MSAGLGAPGRRVGGTCVNRGCLPSKNLIEAARTYWESRNPRYPGRGAVDMPLDFGALVAQKDAVIGDYRGRRGWRASPTASGSRPAAGAGPRG